ncbi:MAG: sulfotransferase family 2 domain-containing protein [Bacteroidetes bacterium]|jgi:hypothetical protein|nr:sulfotransferase family 2 domain-containing protein [Bacteroidota bacterium]
MLRYLYRYQRWRERQQKAELELISIHIPKTAGTSFRNTLKDVYGQEVVVRLDIKVKGPRVVVNERDYYQRQLPPWTRVAHGHFNYLLLQEHFDLPDRDIPVITWMRDPVERVISNYYYLSKRLAEELDEPSKGLNILAKMQRELMEYARAPKSRNRAAHFMKGMPLEDFTFIGIQEYYQEDLSHLAQLLDWKNFKEYTHNRTGKSHDEVTPKQRDEIRALNDEDVRLYEQALALREKRLDK